MQYLFFDLECASCRGGKGKICSFGYVLTNKNFKILKKEDIVINPNISRDMYDDYVVKNILTYSISDIEKHEKFNSAYGKICKLLTDKSTIVCGFGLDNDLKHIADECERYDLDVPKLRCFDVQEFYKNYSGEENKTKLSKLVTALNIDVSMFKEHNSRDDAEMTMLVMKKICKKERLNIVQIMTKFVEKYNFV